jgi:UDP-N-acetylmuramate dehydrogenase
MIQTQLTPRLLRNEPLARYTSWRVGGAADALFVPHGLDELIVFLSALDPDEPVYFIGLGSNLLVRDGGVRGTVVVMHQALKTIKMDGAYLYAEAGVTCGKLAKFSAANSQMGAEFMAGIPGTVGGALAMNAGCYGGVTWDIVHQVLTIDRYGKTHIRKADAFVSGYRTVNMPVAGEWFVGAWFKLIEGDPQESTNRIKDLLAKRLASQPLNYPSGGSTFRNPEGDFAARLIEASGLKGFQIGQAQVSLKHANFIVNLGDCSAHDIESLIEHIKQAVLVQQGVMLQQEVKVIGEYA